MTARKARASAPLVLDFISHSPEQTRRVGWRIGQHARPGDCYLLSGTFGAGKTLLVQGIAVGLQVTDRVTSPSFTLVNEHRGYAADGAPISLYHIDLYRLETAAEVASLGLSDLLDDPQGITAIEWPDRLGAELPSEHLLIMLEPISDMKRRLVLKPSGARYVTLLNEVRAEAFGVDA